MYIHTHTYTHIHTRWLDLTLLPLQPPLTSPDPLKYLSANSHVTYVCVRACVHVCVYMGGGAYSGKARYQNLWEYTRGSVRTLSTHTHTHTHTHIHTHTHSGKARYQNLWKYTRGGARRSRCRALRSRVREQVYNSTWLFYSDTGLTCGDILFCGDSGLFYRCCALRVRVLSQVFDTIWLFYRNIGLICGDVEIFWGDWSSFEEI